MNNAFREYLNAFRVPLMKNECGFLINKRKELLATEEQVWHNDINKEFYERVAEVLAKELAINFDTNPEAVRSFLETFDLQDWINGK